MDVTRRFKVIISMPICKQKPFSLVEGAAHEYIYSDIQIAGSTSVVQLLADLHISPGLKS